MTEPAKAVAREHYDNNAAAMQNQQHFYNWVGEIVARYGPHRELKICDVGCGTGNLLAQFQSLGYTNLFGVDFAEGCLALTRQTVTGVNVTQQDIEEKPLGSRYDLITMTTVIDFLAQPEAALLNIRQSLTENGLLLVTIRNRLAYWPWYHLRGLGAKIMNPRLKHWFLWFTTPLGMRRSDQPFEKVYSPGEAKKLLESAGLKPIASEGMMFLPMFWIPDLTRLVKIMQGLDKIARIIPGKNHYYIYMFVCQSGVGENHP